MFHIETAPDKHLSFSVGIGCEGSDCPGEPDCSGRGKCILGSPPYCGNCTAGWIGKACEISCIRGKAHPSNPTLCICDPCYTGINCDKLCSGKSGARCESGVCKCGFEGWRGQFCQRRGCPGANEEDCSGHGTCDSVTHTCGCDPGYAGIGCENFTCPGKDVIKVTLNLYQIHII